MADIFVSYDTRDSALAHRLGDALKALGHSAHVYEDEVRAGESFVKWMRERLDQVQLFACVYTSGYLTSRYAQFEFDTALVETVTSPGFLLLFRLEDCEVTKVARQFPRCDLFGVADEAEFRARIGRYLATGPARRATGGAEPPAREVPSSSAEKRPTAVRAGIAEGLAAVGGIASTWATLLSDTPVAVRGAAVAIFALPLPPVVYYYYRVLRGAGAAPGSNGWREFGRLRAGLVRGAAFEGVYAGFLTRAVNWLDKFLGDPPADAAGKKPTLAQCWSAAAYDRCLLLALLYPLVTMFVVWAATGHAGDAERAIGLSESPAGMIGLRFAALAAIAPMTFAGRFLHDVDFNSKSELIWWTVIGVAVTVADAFVHGGVHGFVYGVAFAMFVGISSVLAVSSAFLVAVAVLIPSAGDIGEAPFFAFLVATLFMVALMFAFRFLEQEFIRAGNLFLAFTWLAFAGCLAAARYLSNSVGWDRSGALLVFLGLLPLVNAPFDWAAIGLTRYLLRWGLALKGWWPIALALVDAATAAVSVALLAIACVLAVQLFGDIAAHFGGGEHARIIHLAQVFQSLSEAPTASENLWIWFMLFSTAIPSVVNLFIACSAALRALPFVNRWLIAELLEGADMSEPAKIRVALVLAGQWALGALATFWLIYWLFIVVGPLVGPAYAHWLLDLSQSVAACNWPARAIIWLTGGGWQGCM